MEAIKITIQSLNGKKYTISYRAHIEGIGWQEWKTDGQIAGTTRKKFKNGSN